MLKLKPKTLYRWYRDQISNFHSDIKEKKFAAHQVFSLDKATGEVLKTKVVHILKPENVGQKPGIRLQSLKNWITKASKIDAFQLVVNLLERHRDKILAYFTKGQTSARAENLNGRIQRFIIATYGTKDSDLFYYRTQVYFT